MTDPSSNRRRLVGLAIAVAALAGVARESVSRTISDWRRQQRIEVLGRNAYVISKKHLEAEVHRE